MNLFSKITLNIIVAIALTQAVFGAVYTVTKIADTNDGTCDSDCSLREAIAATNGTADNDTIIFASLFNTPQTITLGGTDLIINNNGTLLIFGPGADKLTVSGNNTSRVFSNNTGAVTTIANLRVTGGTGTSTVVSGRGGGVYNNVGNFTLNNVVLTGNTAANGGALHCSSGPVGTTSTCPAKQTIGALVPCRAQRLLTPPRSMRSQTKPLLVRRASTIARLPASSGVRERHAINRFASASVSS